MDSASQAALTGLSITLASLLPPPASPAFTPAVSLVRVDVRPTGVGGFIAFAHDPEGEVLGRRVDADAVVTTRAHTLEDLDTTVQNTVAAVLAADRSTLRAQGVLTIALTELGPNPAGRTNGEFERNLTFHVLYEFLQQPTAPSGVIDRIPLDIEVGRGQSKTLIDTTFGAGSLDLFEVVDDAAATTSAPSAWAVNATEERIEQTSRIRGGGTTATPNKPGTALVLRSTPVLPPVRDFSLRAEVAAGDIGGIGLVFRWQNADNFYFFLMESRRDFRMLGKKVGGAFAAWDAPAVDATQGFAVDQAIQVRVSMEGDAAQAYLDGQRVLDGRDASLPGAGRVGFLSRDCAAAFFDRINLSQW